ncbi:hypothetical protein GUJ93_ZPchr0001g30882 [Zizania palustris]|uniref:Uncharacterized protein n=1 Tax=Zizania palustris TaxID=103762 RepID=A0A8J5VB20_ZIZPA|nr:hypothetical protein GUJ93_ZPchr0001g30882 [Zizania palustris]
MLQDTVIPKRPMYIPEYPPQGGNSSNWRDAHKRVLYGQQRNIWCNSSIPHSHRRNRRST